MLCNKFDQELHSNLLRFNYHLEKVRDIANTAFTNLFPLDEPTLPAVETDDFSEKMETIQVDSVDPCDRLMCEIADEIPF